MKSKNSLRWSDRWFRVPPSRTHRSRVFRFLACADCIVGSIPERCFAADRTRFLQAFPSSKCVRRNRLRIPIQKTIEPVALPVQALDQVLRFAGASQVVVLARKDHHLRVDAIMLQRAEPLLAL